MKRKRLTAGLLSVITLAAAFPYAHVCLAADIPADIDRAAYEYLLKWDLAYTDDNKDGIISDKELSEAGIIKLDLTGVADISWMSRMKKCWLLELSGGELTDFSVLSEMPALTNLEMRDVPVTDLSFMQNLQLERCELNNMPQITADMRMEQMRFPDLTVPAGTAFVLDCKPTGLVSALEIRIDDAETAKILGGNDRTDRLQPRVYGVKEGETAYTVSMSGFDYCTRSITVTDADVLSDPPLGENRVQNWKTAQSLWYCTAHDPDFSDRFYAGKAAFIDGTLYGLFGQKAVRVLTDAADFACVNLNESEPGIPSAAECDIVLQTDGTVLVNGKKLIDEPCTVLHGAFALGKSGTLYCMESVSGSGIAVHKAAEGIKAYVPDSYDLWLDEDDMLCCVRLLENGQGVLMEKTDICGMPVSIVSQKYRTDLVDSSGTCWNISFSDHVPRVNQYSVTQGRSGAERLEYRYDKNGKRNLMLCMKDGSTVLVHEMFDDWGAADISGLHWGAMNMDVSTFRSPAESDEPYPEDCSGILYYLTEAHELRFRWKGKCIRMTHVLGALGSTSNPEENSDLVWIVREDGSIWYYDLHAEEWHEAETPLQAGTGDLNHDGRITRRDIELLHAYLSGGAYYGSGCIAGDLNGDGRLDAVDLTLLLRKCRVQETEKKGENDEKA